MTIDTRAGLAAAAMALGTLLALRPGPAAAAEAYDNCSGFITSLPAVISTQGTWCMDRDLSTALEAGNAIVVETNNVTIDCNHFKLGGLAAGDDTFATGIRATDRSNVTVRNCNIRGFQYGVSLQGASQSGHVVEDNRLDGNTFVGVFAAGDGSVVRRNQFADTGGTPHSDSAIGVFVLGNVDVLDNTVDGVVAASSGTAYGVYSQSATAATIAGNRLRGLVGGAGGDRFGVFSLFGGRIVVRGNDVLDASALAGGIGVACSNNALGSARDNTILGFPQGISFCNNDGGNVVR